MLLRCGVSTGAGQTRGECNCKSRERPGNGKGAELEQLSQNPVMRFVAPKQ